MIDFTSSGAKGSSGNRTHELVRLRLESLEDRCTPATFWVNTDAGTPDVNLADNKALDAFNKTSLRAAIMQGNAIPVNANFPHIIGFMLPPITEGDPPPILTITLQTALDAISQPFSIGGLTPEQLIVQRAAGAAAFPIFHIASGVTVSIGPMTITNGDARGVGLGGGGGVVNEGNLTINGCWIYNNIGDIGGGVLSALGKMSIHGCKIWGNEAPGAAGYGGGIAVISNDMKNRHDIIDSEIYGNETGGAGGGVYVQGSVHLENTTVTGNVAGSHGGGVANAGVFTMEGGKIELNDAAGYGGGLYSESDHSGTALTGVAILDNHSDEKGGGFYVQKGWITVTGSMLKNTATKGIQGGGWKHDPGMATGVTWNLDPGSQAIEEDP